MRESCVPLTRRDRLFSFVLSRAAERRTRARMRYRVG